MNFDQLQGENVGDSFDQPSQSADTPQDPNKMTRIEKLERSEVEIEEVKKLVADCIGELTKEKQISRNKFDELAGKFKKTVQRIEEGIDGQLDYLLQLSVGGTNQVTSWANRQNLALAKETNMGLHTRLRELLSKFDFPSESPLDSIPVQSPPIHKDDPMSPGEEL